MDCTGISAGSTAIESGLGFTGDAMGASSEEGLNAAFDKLMVPTQDKSFLSYEHSLFAKPEEDWGNATVWAIQPDGTRIDASTYYGQHGSGLSSYMPTKYGNTVEYVYNFENAPGQDFNPDWVGEMYDQLYTGQQRGAGRQYLDNWLQHESLKNVGMDPYEVVGHENGRDIYQWEQYGGLSDDDRYKFLEDTYSDTSWQNVYEMNAQYGIDDEGNPYDEGTFDIESISKKWQDIQNVGWSEAGVFDDMSPFAFHFEDPADNLPTWDPDLNNGQGGLVYPQKAPINPMQFAKEHPWMSLLGGGGLLASLLMQANR